LGLGRSAAKRLWPEKLHELKETKRVKKTKKKKEKTQRSREKFSDNEVVLEGHFSDDGPATITKQGGGEKQKGAVKEKTNSSKPESQRPSSRWENRCRNSLKKGHHHRKFDRKSKKIGKAPGRKRKKGGEDRTGRGVRKNLCRDKERTPSQNRPS